MSSSNVKPPATGIGSKGFLQDVRRLAATATNPLVDLGNIANNVLANPGALIPPLNPIPPSGRPPRYRAPLAAAPAPAPSAPPPPQAPAQGQSMRDYAIQKGIIPAPSEDSTAPAEWLHSGTFGCAYRPPLKCDGESTAKKGTVTKLMVESAAEEEIVEANKVRNIDPDQKYFVYAERACDRTIHGQTADSAAIEKCTPIRKVPAGEKAKLLVMSDGGDNLTDFAQSFRGSTLDFGRLRKALESMGNLFEGLKKLHDAGYVHFDIKPDNTVINSEFKTRFIDFGLTRSHLWKLPDTRYDVDYFAWPFQLHYLSDAFRNGFHRNSRIVDQGEYLKYALHTHLLSTRRYKPGARDLGMITRREVTNGQVEYVTPPNGFLPSELPLILSFRDNPKKFVSDIFVSTDVYSLGRTLAIFYYDLTEHKPSDGLRRISHPQYPELVEFSRLWYTMTEMMSHVMQEKRWTLQQAHDYYNSTILPNIPKFFPNNGASRRGTKRKTKGRRTRRRNFPRVG